MEMNRDLVPSAPKPADDDAGEVLCCSSPTSSLEAAMSVRNALRQKLDAAKTALDELDSDRKALAFDAHVSGADAKTKLAALNKRRVLLVADIEMLEIAILEASRRVEDAERAEALAEDGENATRAVEIAADLVVYGQKIDEALTAFSEAANGYLRAVEELNYKLGVSAPSVRQLQSALNRVLRTVVIFTPARDAVEFIAPGEQRTMTAVADGHAAAIARIAGPRLPNNGEAT
jgi:hypothetical protein